MKLVIQFGLFKGKTLYYPDGYEARPTLARARDVLFNWLYRCDDMHVLDLFAGTGILGFQSLCLGASHIDFVDINEKNIQEITKQAHALGFEKKVSSYKIDAFSFLRGASKKYDLIFLDPPFKDNLLEEIMLSVDFKNIIHEKTLIYCEVDKLTNTPSCFNFFKQKAIGDVKIYLGEFKK